MHRALVVLACWMAIPRSGPSQENLRFQLDSTWNTEPGNVQEVRNQYLIMEFVKKGETIDSWRELVTVQNFGKSWGGRSARAAYDALRDVRERRCPGATTWEVIAEDKTSITYADVAVGCAGVPDQRELVRILFAKKNRYRVSYTTKRELTPQVREFWIAWLAGLGLN